MKIEVYETTTRDLDSGVWRREKRGTIELDVEERLIGSRYATEKAAKVLGLNPDYTRCFPAGEKVKMSGKYSKKEVLHLRKREAQMEDESMGGDELDAKYGT